MSSYIINDFANGVWAAERGTVVTVEDHSSTGRAALVRMPSEPQKLEQYAGKVCWLPATWLRPVRDSGYTEREEAPRCEDSRSRGRDHRRWRDMRDSTKRPGPVQTTLWGGATANRGT